MRLRALKCAPMSTAGLLRVPELRLWASACASRFMPLPSHVFAVAVCCRLAMVDNWRALCNNVSRINGLSSACRTGFSPFLRSFAGTGDSALHFAQPTPIVGRRRRCSVRLPQSALRALRGFDTHGGGVHAGLPGGMALWHMHALSAGQVCAAHGVWACSGNAQARKMDQEGESSWSAPTGRITRAASCAL